VASGDAARGGGGAGTNPDQRLALEHEAEALERDIAAVWIRREHSSDGHVAVAVRVDARILGRGRRAAARRGAADEQAVGAHFLLLHRLRLSGAAALLLLLGGLLRGALRGLELRLGHAARVLIGRLGLGGGLRGTRAGSV